MNHNLPPGGLNFFLGDSVEAPGAAYNLSKTHVNLVFGDADNSSAIPIGQDWFNNITSTKTQACVPGAAFHGEYSCRRAADCQRPDRHVQAAIAKRDEH